MLNNNQRGATTTRGASATSCDSDDETSGSNSYELPDIGYDSLVSHSLIIIYVEEALNLKPVNPAELHYLRGRALCSLSRYAAACDDFSKSLELLKIAQVHHLGLHQWQVFHDRMIAYVKLGQISRAYDDCRKLEDLAEEEEKDSWLEAGKILFDRGALADARLFLDNVNAKTPECWLMLFKIHFREARYPDALECIRNISNTQIKTSLLYQGERETLKDFGITLIMTGHFDEGLDNFVLCHKKLKKHALSSERRHNLLLSEVRQLVLETRNQQRHLLPPCSADPTASSSTSTTTEIACGCAYSELFAGLVYLSNWPDDTADKALSSLDKAISLVPRLLEAHFYRALLRAVILCSDFHSNNRSVIRLALDDVEEYLSLVRSAPGREFLFSCEERGLVLRSYILLLMGDSASLARALEDCNAAIDLDPNDDRAYAMRAIITRDPHELRIAERVHEKQHRSDSELAATPTPAPTPTTDDCSKHQSVQFIITNRFFLGVKWFDGAAKIIGMDKLAGAIQMRLSKFRLELKLARALELRKLYREREDDRDSELHRHSCSSFTVTDPEITTLSASVCDTAHDFSSDDEDDISDAN